ncbi:MAG: DUF2848 family protein [Clostridia bacterium]|nr:DUF2848 family protein [Clostridia bacterium]
MNTLKLYLDNDPGQVIEYQVRRIVNGGFSGRNQEEVWKHIRELEKIGVPAPKSTPTFYPLLPDKVTTSTELLVIGTGNSGEVEYALLCGDNSGSPDRIWVALASDHTDRDLETMSILKSKQVYPNIISTGVWRLSDVLDHWDVIAIRSWVGRDRAQIYQDSTLAAIMRPEELLDKVRGLMADGDLGGTIILSGTVATKGELSFHEWWESELADPVRGQTLTCNYHVQPIDWFKGEA